MNQKKMLFTAPKFNPNASQDCNDILKIGALSARLAQEERSFIAYQNGRPENVAEHSHMLSRVAPLLAARHYPELSLEKVALFATIHDDVEAYVGDTPTHEPQHHVGKEAKEHAGLQVLLSEFEDIPEYTLYVTAYEEQIQAEARFVRVVDKLLPLVTNLTQGGAAFAAHWTKEELIFFTNQKSDALESQYPEFKKIINLRRELSLLAAATLDR